MPHQKPMKWPLPETLHPAGRVCYQVSIPNEVHYIGAFLGAMFLLTKPYAWADDPDHTAIEVGAVWRDIYNELAPGCGGPAFTIACDYNFADSDQGFAPIVAGGNTYATYSGSLWEAGCQACSGAPYSQLQIFKNISSAVLYSASVQYSSLVDMNFVMVNNVDSTSSVHGPAGDHQILSVAGPLPTSVIRPILTTDAGTGAVNFSLERLSVTIGYPSNECP